MNERANEPAYPAKTYRTDDYPTGGLTIREHFAGLAMQAYITRIPGADLYAVARDSLIAADALIAALNQEQGK